MKWVLKQGLVISWRSHQQRQSASYVAVQAHVLSLFRQIFIPIKHCLVLLQLKINIWKTSLETKGLNNEKIWQSILENDGSISHLNELNENEKAIFKTAFEIDQRWIVEMAADRTPYICQSQSINLYLSADIDKWDLMMLHWKAWEFGIKKVYIIAGQNQFKELVTLVLKLTIQNNGLKKYC